jgi:hypothetical protein
MRSSARQQLVFVTKLVLKGTQRGLWLGDQAPSLLTAWTDQVSFGHLICDGYTDGGYVIASRVSVDFSDGNLLQLFENQRLAHTGSPFSRHRRSSGHVVTCASEGVEQQPALRVQILSGHYNTAVRVPLPLQLRESEMFDLGSVP